MPVTTELIPETNPEAPPLDEMLRQWAGAIRRPTG